MILPCRHLDRCHDRRNCCQPFPSKYRLQSQKGCNKRAFPPSRKQRLGRANPGPRTTPSGAKLESQQRDRRSAGFGSRSAWSQDVHVTSALVVPFPKASRTCSCRPTPFHCGRTPIKSHQEIPEFRLRFSLDEWNAPQRIGNAETNAGSPRTVVLSSPHFS